MGFQGDVAGLGLGELLQGLARGGREGVLTLHGEGLSATLGVENGQIFLLPEPDEDPELWRKRSERAWVKDPNQRIDALRMSEIAFAARLERMFELLDCEGVHFRFEPGPLPSQSPLDIKPESDVFELDRPTKIDAGRPVFCPPISVETLLLEHARLADECQTYGDSHSISPHDVPRLFDAGSAGQLSERFFAECDGMSNVVEIADRVAWPLRQCRAVVQAQIAGGLLRLSDPRELLALCQRELSQNRFARAASRLAGWCVRSAPGPVAPGDAELLLGEWQGGKLPLALASMAARDARTLLRRLEHTAPDPQASLLRWREMRKHHRHDSVCEIRILRWQLASDPQAPPLSDLLKLARNLQDAGHDQRAGILLRVAAGSAPETTSMQLELGTRMLGVGMVEEGAPLVLDVCRTLIESNLIEKALPPLRAVLAADPANKTAKRLLSLARGKSVRSRSRRRNLVVALSVLLLLSLVAFVQMRGQAEQARRLADVVECSSRPDVALLLLEEGFAGDESPEIQSLRESLRERVRRNEVERREAWMALHRECQLECTLGDPLLGLQRTLELPPPPSLSLILDPWPSVSEIYEALAGRLEQSVAEQAAASAAPPSEELHAEQRLARMIDDLLAAAGKGENRPELESFVVRLTSVQSTVRLRAAQRAAERRDRLKRELLVQQDLLLAAARAHAAAGDLERAVESFHRLVDMEGSEVLRPVLAQEIGAVEAHYQAVLDARRLAAEGRHPEALATLESVCPRPGEHLLPWRLVSEPTGARARFADGSTRVTPCVLETAPGERLDFTLELAGHETARIALDVPGDRTFLLSRLPSRWWRTAARVDAPPVSVEDDHVMCDRTGVLARLGSGAEPRWTCRLESLGGIARAPVFMPRRPGFLLLVTEEGLTWLVEASTGKLEGPWNMGSPPSEGPVSSGRTVSARFTDGRRAQWETRLKPELIEDTVIGPASSESGPASGDAKRPALYGTTAGLELLRRRTGEGHSLESPWTSWVVEIQEQVFAVKPSRGSQPAFHVRRDGEWVYAAWEAPHSKIPRGRLWISDGAGLRAFEP